MRIGHGFDVHAFCEGDAIVLCGIRIPHDKAFKAHSDGDVALHALCDACWARHHWVISAGTFLILMSSTPVLIAKFFYIR